MRTKEEIAIVLAKRQLPESLKVTTWADFISGINGLSQEQKDGFLQLITERRVKKAGEMLFRAVHEDAVSRAKVAVDIALANNTLSLDEIDLIL